LRTSTIPGLCPELELLFAKTMTTGPCPFPIIRGEENERQWAREEDDSEGEEESFVEMGEAGEGEGEGAVHDDVSLVGGVPPVDDSIGGRRCGACAAEVTIETIRESEMEVTIREGHDEQNEEGVGEHEDDKEEGDDQVTEDELAEEDQDNEDEDENEMVIAPQLVYHFPTAAEFTDVFNHVQATHALDHWTLRSLQRGFLNNAIRLLITKLDKGQRYSWAIMGFGACEWVRNCKNEDDPIKWIEETNERDPRSMELEKFDRIKFNRDYFRRNQ
jgi:hypothetical protein